MPPKFANLLVFVILSSYFIIQSCLLANQVYAADQAQPPAQVLVISQVRGTECCDPGSLDKLKSQVELFKKYNIPAYLTLRYDALTNPDFTKYLQTEVGESIKLGLFLEITPELAKSSGVEYGGDEQTWYQAQHAYTIGFLPPDRQKIIDHLFKTFYQHFNYYPELTTAWIADTPTLNYIHDKYGVKVHELTREQWGTDSYTLWGGPEHYPYPASRNWVLLPDFEQLEPLMIVRQTVSDPLLSYADESSSFTSQPNDYIRDGKNFGYFKDLLNQTISQPGNQTGFAVLGLETSMDAQHQQEFIKQIEYLSQLHQDDKITFADIAELSTNWTQRLSLYAGSDLVKKSHNISYTINSPNYRIRLRQNINNVFIDDLRVYSSKFTDPYTTYQAYRAGYWVIPDLIDGGRWYGRKLKKPILNRLFDPPELTSSVFQPAKSDLDSDPSRLELPQINSEDQIQVILDQEKNTIVASYQSKNNQTVILTFNPDSLEISPADSSLQYISYKPGLDQTGQSRTATELKNNSKISWPADRPLIGLQKTCTAKGCKIAFSSNPAALAALRDEFYPFLFPERRPREISGRHTLIFAHNHYALANQNPVRLIIAPFDQYNFPTSLKNSPTITTEPAVDTISQPTISPNSVATYFDLHHSQPQQLVVTVDLGNNLTRTEKVYFAPDCQQSQQYCLTHPRQAWWFLRFKIWDWLRNKLEKS